MIVWYFNFWLDHPTVVYEYINRKTGRWRQCIGTDKINTAVPQPQEGSIPCCCRINAVVCRRVHVLCYLCLFAHILCCVFLHLMYHMFNVASFSGLSFFYCLLLLLLWLRKTINVLMFTFRYSVYLLHAAVFLLLLNILSFVCKDRKLFYRSLTYSR